MITIEQAWANPQIPWLEDLTEVHKAQIKRRLTHGDLNRWLDALIQIPDIAWDSRTLGQEVGLRTIPDQARAQLESALRGLMPWRKGPFRFGPIHVDTEWQSGLKWDRLKAHINLRAHRVLDVGSGSGYHLWRMLEAGADEVLGIDPNILFHCQFAAVKGLLGHLKAASLPLTLEEFDAGQLRFDTVFSMGVLYHRKDPVVHLEQLKRWIQPGGQLVLETLIINGDETNCIIPPGRYAHMNNVWFLPSVRALIRWLGRIGFIDVQCIDVSVTTAEEQRKTSWMQFESLEDALDRSRPHLTVEGLPRPTRAIFLARRPRT